jgi:hypothetical protein
VKAAKTEDLVRVMKEWFPGVLPSGEYAYSVSIGFDYEGQDLYLSNRATDYYWRAHCSQEAIRAAHTFGDVYGKALNNLRDMVWEQEDMFLRGYH